CSSDLNALVLLRASGHVLSRRSLSPQRLLMVPCARNRWLHRSLLRLFRRPRRRQPKRFGHFRVYRRRRLLLRKLREIFLRRSCGWRRSGLLLLPRRQSRVEFGYGPFREIEGLLPFPVNSRNNLVAKPLVQFGLSLDNRLVELGQE